MPEQATDFVAAAIHRKNADRHYDAAARLARIPGMENSAKAARRAARDEDRIAETLEGRDPYRPH